MTKEDIEKAAAEYASEACRPLWRIGYEQVCMVDFIEGAKWRINSIWHDVSEMPEKKFALVEYGCFPKGYGYLVVPDPREVIGSITRWAYIEDLIPNMED
jgi:hypothetical protein